MSQKTHILAAATVLLLGMHFSSAVPVCFENVTQNKSLNGLEGLSGNGAKATWYDPVHNQHACAFGPYDETAYPFELPIYNVAVPDVLYRESALCGSCVRIRGPIRSVVALVTDRCPECEPNHLDLGIKTFKAVADFQKSGLSTVSWEFVPCDYATPQRLKYRFTTTTQQYYLKLQVSGNRYPITSVDLQREDGNFGALTRSFDNHWVCNGCGSGPFTFKTTLSDGTQIIDTIPMRNDGILRYADGKDAALFENVFENS